MKSASTFFKPFYVLHSTFYIFLTSSLLLLSFSLHADTVLTDYQEVEYLKADGHQNIVPDYAISAQTTKIECKYFVGKDKGIFSGKYATVFGEEAGNRFFIRYNNASGSAMNAYYQGGNMSLTGFAVPSGADGVTATNTITTTFTSSGFSVDINGTMQSRTASMSFSATSIRIFSCVYNTTDMNNPSTIGLFHFKIWEGENCVRDLVPCYRKSDNVAGLYDLANDVFYPNHSDSGIDFTVGPDVLVEHVAEIRDALLARDVLNSGHVSFTCDTRGFSGTPVYSWYVDGAETPAVSGTEYATASLFFDQIGKHTVKVVVSDGVNSAEDELVNCVSVMPATLYVSPTSTPAFPYSTPQTAANTPAEALAAAISGCEIVVEDGVYTGVGQLTMKPHLTIHSRNGAEKVKFVASGNIHLFSVPVSAAGVTIDGITGDGNGQAGFLSCGGAGTSSILNCVVTNCTGSTVISYDGENNVISNCSIIGCSSRGNGSLIRGQQGSALFTHNRVIGNYANNDRYSGIYNDYQGLSTVRNCLFADNTTVQISISKGFVIDIKGGMSVESCTVVNNRYLCGNDKLGFVPYAVDFSSNNSSSLKNCIVWDNTVEGEEDAFDVPADTRVSYTCSSNEALTDETYAANHNLAADPQFSGPVRFRYRLNTASPCRDTGSNSSWMTSSVDIEGRPRIRKNGIVDMGCSEWYSPGKTVLMVK